MSNTENKDFAAAFAEWEKENSPLFKETAATLEANGKDASQLTSMLDYIKQMQETITQSAEQIGKMEAQIAEMKEIQKHPIKNVLNNICESLKTSLEKAKESLKNLMNKVVEGCKKIVQAGKDNVALIDGALTEWNGDVTGAKAIIKENQNIVGGCDKATKAIETFFTEKLANVGRNIKNAGKALTGKTDEINTEKIKLENSKAAAVFSAPFKAVKSITEFSTQIQEKRLEKAETILEKASIIKDERSLNYTDKEIDNGVKKGTLSAETAGVLKDKAAEARTSISERKQSLTDRLKASTERAKQSNLERNKTHERAKTAEIG